jgi:hypothetical protein
MVEGGENQKVPNSEKNSEFTVGRRNKKNKEKELDPRITWPEMHQALLLTSDDGKPIVESDYLIKAAKNLSAGGENRVTESNLEHILQRIDDGYYSGEFGEKEAAIIGGVVDKKLTEKRNVIQKKEILKGMKSPELVGEKDLPAFFKQRNLQEKELDLILKKDERELTEADKMRTNQLVESLYGKPLSEMDLSFFGSSSEKPPKVEEVGVNAYSEWFENKIHALIEEYPDQNFETNWTLTYTIQQGVNSLWPKDGKDEFQYKVKGINGQEIIRKDSYTRLRKELAVKLESYRAIHNFIYLYKRVPGVGEAIGPAGLLDLRYIECLFKEKGEFKGEWEFESIKEEKRESVSVADALREFYVRGEKSRKEKDKDKQKKIIQDMEEFQAKSWQARVAGGLYSAFQGGGRDNLTLNQGGDFFTGRLYNMPSWAQTSWEEQWKRKPWPEMYKALDLKVRDFWTRVFKGAKDEDLKKLNITKEETSGQPIYRFNSESKFEEIDLVGNKDITLDHLKHVILDLEEADNIRKMILNPRGLLDEPKFAHIKPMWEKFKHLKGEDRSKWFAPVIRELALFFKDETAPWSDDIPLSMRRCRAKEVYPYINPMDNEQIINIVGGLTPPLTPKDMERVLKEAVGTKSKRVLQKTGRVVGGTIWSMIVEGVKAGLGMK